MKMKMKNVFARTVLALVLIPSFWMTSVGTVNSQSAYIPKGSWVVTPGEVVGKMVRVTKYKAVLDRFATCHGGILGMGPTFVGDNGEEVKHMQFIYTAGLDGTCYYYAAGGPSSGAAGDYTWRYVK